MRLNLLLAAGLFAAAGCVGGIEGNTEPDDPTGDDPPAGSQARILFQNNVRPLLAQCAACHGNGAASPTQFVAGAAATADDAYVQATGYTSVVGSFTPTTAGMLTRPVPADLTHAVYAWDTGEISTITGWLAQEVLDRSGGPDPGPPPTESPGQASDRLMNEFSACMDLAEWDTTNIAVLWSQMGSDEGPCIRCHVNGQASFISTTDSTRMFNIVSSNRYFMLTMFAPNVTGTVAERMMVPNMEAFMRVATSQPPHQQHPQFNMPNDAWEATQAFYDLTSARITQNKATPGLCGPTRLVEPM